MRGFLLCVLRSGNIARINNPQGLTVHFCVFNNIHHKNRHVTIARALSCFRGCFFIKGF